MKLVCGSLELRDLVHMSPGIYLANSHLWQALFYKCGTFRPLSSGDKGCTATTVLFVLTLHIGHSTCYARRNLQPYLHSMFLKYQVAISCISVSTVREHLFTAHARESDNHKKTADISRRDLSKVTVSVNFNIAGSVRIVWTGYKIHDPGIPRIFPCNS